MESSGWLVSDLDLETIPEKKVEVKPPGFDKVVERMRKHKREQESIKTKVYKRSVGENYKESR